MNELTRLGIKHHTDKAYWHKFTEIYHDYFLPFKDKKINILEIGIFKGGSIKMLNDYFPNANIYCIDTDQKWVSGVENYSDRIFPFNFSQSSRDSLKEFMKLVNVKFDIIIDDGNHEPKDQMLSMGFLFDHLNTGSIYICEDLHTSVLNDNDSNVKYFIQNYKNYKSPFLLDKEYDNLKNKIKCVEIWKRTDRPYKCWYCNKEITNEVKCCVDLIPVPENESVTSILTT